jgi:basic amino acid/polyamine antiporter, APA family
MEKSKILLRPASGLVKSIGVFGAFVFGVHCISLSSSGFIPFSWVASVWPGASIIGLLLIAIVMSLVHGYTYASIGITMPRTGADYVLASRVLNPILAFVASWTLVIFSGVVVGGLIAWIPQSAIPALLKPMSIIFNNETFSIWADYSATQSGSMIIGSIFIIITFVLMLFPNKIIVRIMAIGFVLGVLAWVVILYSLVGNSADAFEVAWNKFMASSGEFGSFDKRIELAKLAGLEMSSSKWLMTLAGLIMGFWIFYGYYIPTFFAGEVSKAGETKRLIIASLSAIIVTGGIFILAAYLLQNMVSLEWIAAEGYIFNNPDAIEKVAGHAVTGYPWITFYAAILKPYFPLVLFTAFAWIFTLINLAQTYFFYASRIVFAWSFDRIIPKKFAYVSPSSKSPVYSIIAIMVLAFIGLIDASTGGPLGTQMTFAFFAVVTQIVSVLAIILYPYKYPKQFELAPSFLTKRLWGVPRISIIGTFTLLYLIWMVIASFLFPAVGIQNPKWTVLILVIIATLGLFVFLSARNYHKKKSGFDINLIYKDAPPA